MSNEEMNKKMEFIVEQQAKFTADIDILREIQETAARRLGGGFLSMMDIVGQLTRTQIRTEETVNTLAQGVSTLVQDVSKLTQAQAQTEERLTILINIVERHMGGNGGSTSPA
jgi:flagellar motor switch protein FliM